MIIFTTSYIIEFVNVEKYPLCTTSRSIKPSTTVALLVAMTSPPPPHHECKRHTVMVQSILCLLNGNRSDQGSPAQEKMTKIWGGWVGSKGWYGWGWQSTGGGDLGSGVSRFHLIDLLPRLWWNLFCRRNVADSLSEYHFIWNAFVNFSSYWF